MTAESAREAGRSRTRRQSEFLTNSTRVLLVLLWCTCASLEPGCRKRLDEQAGADLVARWTHAYNSHDLPGFVAFYAPSGAYMVPPMLSWVTSRAELRATMDKVWRETPDARITATDRLVVGRDRIAFVWEMSFTDRQTGTPGALLGASFMEFEDGLINNQGTVFTRQDVPPPAGPSGR